MSTKLRLSAGVQFEDVPGAVPVSGEEDLPDGTESGAIVPPRAQRASQIAPPLPELPGPDLKFRNSQTTLSSSQSLSPSLLPEETLPANLPSEPDGEDSVELMEFSTLGQQALEFLLAVPDAEAQTVMQQYFEAKPSSFKFLVSRGLQLTLAPECTTSTFEGREMKNRQTYMDYQRMQQLVPATGKDVSDILPDDHAAEEEDEPGPLIALKTSQRKDSRTAKVERGHSITASAELEGCVLESERPEEDMHSETSSNHGEEIIDPIKRSIIQFSTSMYFCCPQYEDVMTLDLMRIGNVDGVSQVVVCTVDQSAKSGDAYRETSTVVTFEPGEFQVEFEIPLLRKTRWGTTTEFLVVCRDEGLKGAELGRYLYQARVKIINKNAFPTNRYKTQIESDTIDSVPTFYVLWEYFKFNFRDPIVRRGSIKLLFVNVLHNLKFLLKALCNVYLLNEVLNTERSKDDLVLVQSRSQSLIALMVLAIILLIPLHFIDHKAPTWGVIGRSQSMLQESLLTKYLNYEVVSRNQLPDGSMLLAATRDRRELVQKGYMKMLSLTRSMGQIVIVALFQFLTPAMFGVPINLDAFIPLLCYPFIIIVLLVLRWKVVFAALSRADTAENSFAALVESAQRNLRIIIDYQRRPHYENLYKEKVKEYNIASIVLLQVLCNNKYLGSWVKEFFVGLYVFRGGMQVINGDLSFGIYLTNTIMVQEIGDSWGNIYETLLEMTECIPNLDRFIQFLNLPIDVERRMTLNRARRQWSNQARMKARENAKETAKVQSLPLDTMPIIVEKISQSNYTISGNMTIQQGELVAVVGPPGEGKSTILKMLGGVLLPVTADPGFFVPSHLRCLHVCEEALFFRGTLKANLTFSLDPGHVDARVERIEAVLRMLKVSEAVVERVASEEECEWSTILSVTQAHQLKLARALVCNPELLIIQKPTMAFDERQSRTILAVLKKYVRHRGVALDKATRHLRRPRTCIATSSKVFGVEISDQVFMVSKSHGMRKIDRQDVAPIMLG